MNPSDKKNRFSGITGTALFHLLILALLLLAKCSSDYHAPVIEDIGGILINFGESEEGTGLMAAIDASVNKEESPSVIEENTKPLTNTENNKTGLKTQETEEAPSIEKKNEETKTESANTNETQPQVDPNALYVKNRNKDAAAASEGTSGNKGDQGSPDGNPLSDNYSHGGGEGYNWTLNGIGRRLAGKIEVHDESQETGKVVVQISVGRDGSVTNAVPVLFGSTTTNQYLWRLAKQSALTAKFTPSPDAPEEQKGTIVFDFILLK